MRGDLRDEVKSEVVMDSTVVDLLSNVVKQLHSVQGNHFKIYF
jgi:hypothetical protein